ncbi:methyltransferase domain-containing protein [Geoglobus acetivorans]|uniref:Class I SAM-dependent methyltransferase n=1 Tax=Geoglobus acetivorans TaxID=565033 RepID=A0ABZ3H0N8_GEOAI|nr:class I SAM-dependent methyltransferase [Geoglobus acetivorans]
MGILEKFEQFEGEGAGRYDRAVSKLSSLLYWHAIRDLKKLGVNGRYLEAGCGPGILAVRVARELGVEVVAFDLSVSMVEIARKRARDAGVNVRFMVGDVENDYFGEFDVVYSTFSLHHWNNPEKGLKNLWRMVKSGGVLYILDARKERFIGHGLSFDKFRSLFEGLENAEKIEVRKRFPLMASAVAVKGV